MFVIAGTLLALFLLGKFWERVVRFLNGSLRDVLERLLGKDRCGWYVDFVIWLDNVATATINVVRGWYERFKSNVLMINSKYRPALSEGGGMYVNSRETIVAIDSERARRVVIEETVPYHALPAPVRHEMLLKRVDSAELDERELVGRRVEENIATLELAR